MVLSKFLDILSDRKVLVVGAGVLAVLAFVTLQPSSTLSVGQLSGRHTTRRIEVPKGKMGAIIGSNGNIIRGLEAHHKATVQFSRKDADNSDPNVSILVIRGSPENVNAAEMEVRHILSTVPTIISEEMKVPQASLGVLIGRKGETIKEITNLSRAKVKICSSGVDPETITIRGKPECVAHAKELIAAKLSDADEKFNKIKEAVGRRTRVDPNTLFQNPQKNFFGLSPGAKVYVYVTAVCNPSQFYVQQLTGQLVGLDKLTNEMQMHYGTGESNPSDKFEVGEYVAALSAHDSKYYRAVVSEMEADRADLKFVDYGEDAYVALTDLRKLPVNFFRLSLQAIECKLAKIRPVDDVWSDDAIKFFELITHLSQSKELRATVVSERNGVAELELHDLTIPGTPIDIALQMVTKGFAVYDTDDCQFARMVEQNQLNEYGQLRETEAEPMSDSQDLSSHTVVGLNQDQSATESDFEAGPPSKPGLSPWSPWSRHTLSRDNSALDDVGAGPDESFSSAREALSRVENFTTPAEKLERQLPPYMQIYMREKDEENLDLSGGSDTESETGDQ